MKTWITIIMVSIALMSIHLACSAPEQEEFAAAHPRFAPATQMTESIQRTIDPFATKARQSATIVRDAADGAAALGVPGASTVALIAGAVGTMLGVYNERRRGTAPLRTAFEQVVNSVEAAFPSRTEMQKIALSAVQDEATRKLVGEIKGS
jgi:hypothetical protein